ncbi:DNA mismatch repair protein MutS [Pedobacter frigiditerrae]|uniref:DNA mismatch repair protein MutS n=1 Tax=Pedobacter frigiditerrae TaxID=2530452 RepID=A0A4R0N0X7_9SPHI|nr:Smr/MutS family protein [Pedobacter frigiditerrae]TCC93408.1 DNA mismatch repair protein MutS [Pedobacter frigiditerrae]
MFKLGDFVRFVDEKREGYVTRVIDAQTLGVTDTDGFEIPVAISNLTHVHGHHSTVVSHGDNQKPIIVDEEFKEVGVFLAVAEDSKASAVAHFTLINNTSYQLLLSLKTDKKGIYKGEFASTIQPKTSTQLYSANLGDLEVWPEFIFQILYFTTGNIKPKEPISLTRKFKAKDFSGAKKQVQEINKYAWLIQLDEPVPLIDAKKLKESFFKAPASKPVVEQPAIEIDLHIEKLRNDYQFLSQSEIIDIQLSYFQQMLDAAIVHQMPSIVFIHGVGNGTLRHHIHKAISKHPQVRTFMDAQKEKFGFGATEVIFKI